MGQDVLFDPALKGKGREREANFDLHLRRLDVELSGNGKAHDPEAETVGVIVPCLGHIRDGTGELAAGLSHQSGDPLFGFVLTQIVRHR